MKNIFKYTLFGLFLLIVLTLCGTFVLYIYSILLNIVFENIWYSGFKVAMIASALLFADWYRRSKCKSKL